MRLRWCVSEAEAGWPLRDILSRRLFLSTALRIACQRAETITVDDLPARAHQRLQAGAQVEVRLPPGRPPEDVLPEEGALTILYEDEALLAVEKPGGMLTHPSHAQHRGSLQGLVLGYLRSAGQALCAHPVHRLDRGTGGVVIFAKHPHVQARWMAALRGGQVEKQYEGIAWGAWTPETGEVTLPIARENAINQRRVPREDGQAALSRYRVLATWRIGEQAVSRVALWPVTGRTHQLRVHSAALGFPLLGDRLYGTAASQVFSDVLGLSGQCLHAVQLCFAHPLTGSPLRIVSPARWPEALACPPGEGEEGDG